MKKKLQQMTEKQFIRWMRWQSIRDNTIAIIAIIIIWPWASLYSAIVHYGFYHGWKMKWHYKFDKWLWDKSRGKKTKRRSKK
jgi:hypothetical protein